MSKLLKQGDNIVILNKLIAGNIKKAEISEICCSNFDNKSLAEYIYDGSEFYPVPNLNYMVMNTISLHNKKISGSNQIVNGITK